MTAEPNPPSGAIMDEANVPADLRLAPEKWGIARVAAVLWSTLAYLDQRHAAECEAQPDTVDIDGLIAASSLGDAEALAIRAGADPAVVARVLARADELGRANEAAEAKARHRICPACDGCLTCSGLCGRAVCAGLCLPAAEPTAAQSALEQALARITELEQRLARVAELAHDRNGDTLEWRSKRLGKCASVSWDHMEETFSTDPLKRRSTLKWAKLAAQLTASEERAEQANVRIQALSEKIGRLPERFSASAFHRAGLSLEHASIALMVSRRILEDAELGI